MPSFAQLAVIVLAGMCGPLLSSSRKVLIPVVVGELLAGVALGATGAGIIKAADPTIAFLGNVGLAVLMMVVGMHVPLRNRALTGSLIRGGFAVALTGALAVGAGLAIAHGLGVGHPMVWAVLLAAGSAAVVVTAIEEANVDQSRALLAIAWATIANVATIVAVPLVLDPGHALQAGLGAVAVAAGAALVLLLARGLRRNHRVRELRRQSKAKGWALDLRISLLALFALCALAEWVGTNILIAGFAAGLIVALEGGPRRLSDQVAGVASGFLVPVFFVVLGASLNARALIQSSSDLELVGALIAGLIGVHLLAAAAVRAPVSTALIVCAQLGVPAAVVKLGLASHVLTPGQGAAIIVAALASLAVCAAGTALAKRRG